MYMLSSYNASETIQRIFILKQIVKYVTRASCSRQYIQLLIKWQLYGQRTYQCGTKSIDRSPDIGFGLVV